MDSAATESALQIDIDPVLFRSILKGTTEGLAMTGVTPPPVGTSRLVSSSRSMAVVVGLCGRANGTMTLSLADRTMLYLAGKLMGETQTEVNMDNLDAIGEIGNMIAGCIKDTLSGTDYEVSNISVPSLVLGANYSFYFTRGFNTCCVEFEVPEIPIVYQRDRFFTTTVSLLRRVG